MADRAPEAMMVGQFPEGIALRLDPGTRRRDAGRTLIGGSPVRITRVTDAGARVIDDFVAGGAVGPSDARQRLARRLIDGGLAHPIPPPLDPDRLADMTGRTRVVIPVKDDAAAIGDLLDHLDAQGLSAQVRGIVVVDDGSRDAAALHAAIAGRAALIRSATSHGPGPARNLGWRHGTGAERSDEVIAFVDADVRPAAGWLATLLAHLQDPTVAAVAPRVRAPTPRADASVLDRYEADRSPLDLGDRASGVGLGHRVRYVPSATLLVRRSILADLDGFDPDLRFGEDVDLVWRITEAGHRVRYEPDAEVIHRNRADWTALARQRVGYGSSSAALDRRHPGAVAPLSIPIASLAAWTLVATGTRRGVLAGAVVVGASTAALIPKLARVTDHPTIEAARLAGLGTMATGRWTATAVARTWLPIAVAGSLASPRLARAAALAIATPALADWVAGSRRIDPVTWLGAHLVDDAAYCVGVWRGALAERSAAVLRPEITGMADAAAWIEKWQASRTTR